MTHPAGDGGKLGLHYFPLPDALTMEEYHRLDPDAPAPLTSPADTRVPCLFCGTPFVRKDPRARFDTRNCRLRYNAAQRRQPTPEVAA